MFSRVLIANRGEIAIRIAHAANALNIDTIGIYARADSKSLHTQFVRKAIELRESGSTPLDSYLNIEDLIGIAERQECDCLHPGYGFLSESAELAMACASAGITFIGPSADTLSRFADKVAARQLAVGQHVPVVPGTTEALTDVSAAQSAADEIGYPIMIKAAAGGGGRGMREVASHEELTYVFLSCSNEAEAAFGDGSLFLERLIQQPKHIEVQICGDHTGEVIHLYERDCSVQENHQKVIEIAPAPRLDREVRNRIFEDAIKLARAAEYSNAGTIEFLVNPATQEHYFIECNPRIQVEHTVTEQITGVDLVALQFQIANGSSLEEMGLAPQARLSEPDRFSIQARVSARSTGAIGVYYEPSGPGVRVDATGYSGYEVSSQFDPLLGKVIVTGNPNQPFSAVVDQLRNGVNQYQIGSLQTNLPALTAILDHEEMRSGEATTGFLKEHPIGDFDNGSPPSKFLSFLSRSAIGSASESKATQPSHPSLKVAEDDVIVVSPMNCTIVECLVAEGDVVNTGQTICVVSAMKMETNICSDFAGRIEKMLTLKKGDVIVADQVIAVLTPTAFEIDREHVAEDDTWQPYLDQVTRLQELAEERLAPDSTEPGVVRQRSRGKLTCRERINLLLDDGSFHEVGSITGFASYDEYGDIQAFTPANHVGGWGTIQSRTAIVCADDFTSRGGHADGAIGAKSSYLDRLSIEMRVPSVRLLDGSSGGGSVAAMVPAQKKTGESKAKESSGAIKAGRPRVAGGGGSYLPGHLGSAMYTQQLATVPVINMLLGSVVGIGAAKAVLGHFSVMVRDIAQLFVAGPPVVAHAMGYDITKEELGDWRIHCSNGSVDNLAETEEEAAHMVRTFLSYLPANVYQVPPRHSDRSDRPDRAEEELFHLIPRKRTTTFNIRKAIGLIVDKGSFFEIGKLWGTDQVTGLAHMNGYPIGVIASDSQHANGGALTADGCRKLTRHLDLCDLFHIPVLNLVDNPGFAVGLEHEQAGTIRAGGEWMVAFSQVTVPIFTVLMRRSFGVAGNNYATPRAGPSMRVAWPAADVGGIPPEGGIEAAYKRQLAEADDPVALRAELEARIESARGPLGPLSKFQMEEMIDPRETRKYICDWIEMAYRIVEQHDALGSRPLQFRP